MAAPDFDSDGGGEQVPKVAGGTAGDQYQANPGKPGQDGKPILHPRVGGCLKTIVLEGREGTVVVQHEQGARRRLKAPPEYRRLS